MLRDCRAALDSAALHQWDRLAARASEPNPFFERWFLQPALEAFDPEQKVRLLVLEQDGEWLGLMPASLDLRYYRYPFPQFCTWLHGNCFLGLPLVAAGQEERFWRALLTWADRNSWPGLFLHLSQIPLETRLVSALGTVLTEEKRTAALVHREERALLSSDMTSEAYLAASMTGKKRKELRRQHNRLAELGDLQFHHHTDANELDAWIDAFLTLETAGWKGQRGSAMANSADTASLFRRALAGGAEAGKLERRSITLDGQPIAMLASFNCQPGSFSFKTAYAEEFARFSPGVLLQCANLALLDRDDIAWCDSCAAADHPMIDHIWRERRVIGRISIGVGGGLRRALFRLLARIELGRKPTGISS